MPAPVTISIHAAREGGDFSSASRGLWLTIISIHAAREGGDTKKHTPNSTRNDFNPRRP